MIFIGCEEWKENELKKKKKENELNMILSSVLV